MADLIFRYGVLKTELDKHALELKENRKDYNIKIIKCNSVTDTSLETYYDLFKKDVDLIIVLNAQNLMKFQVDQLLHIAKELNVDVVCYGYRTNYKTDLTEGSKRLLEVCDKISEIRSKCNDCEEKAVFLGKYINNEFTMDEKEPAKYKPLCQKCYSLKLGKYKK